MKDLILVTISILTILVIANIDTVKTNFSWGSIRVIDVMKSEHVHRNVPADTEIKSANDDWRVSSSLGGEKTVYKNGVRLVHLNAAVGAGSLRTAVHK